MGWEVGEMREHGEGEGEGGGGKLVEEEDGAKGGCEGEDGELREVGEKGEEDGVKGGCEGEDGDKGEDGELREVGERGEEDGVKGGYECEEGEGGKEDGEGDMMVGDDVDLGQTDSSLFCQRCDCPRVWVVAKPLHSLLGSCWNQYGTQLNG